MKIDLENKTKFRDADLRAIIRKACAQVGAKPKKLHVEVRRGRSPYVTGRAQLGRRGRWHGESMILVVPDREIADNRPLVEAVAMVAAHEAMHLVGAQHKDMTEEQRYCTGETPEWARALVLRKVEPKPKPDRVAAFEAKLAHVEAMHQKATTRLKRATTIEKKWARRLKALQRRRVELDG